MAATASIGSYVTTEDLVGRLAEKLTWLPAAAPSPEQHVLLVRFRSADGRRWQAIGGGETVSDAIAWARESCPGDASWIAESWNDAYGD